MYGASPNLQKGKFPTLVSPKWYVCNNIFLVKWQGWWSLEQSCAIFFFSSNYKMQLKIQLFNGKFHILGREWRTTPKFWQGWRPGDTRHHWALHSLEQRRPTLHQTITCCWVFSRRHRIQTQFKSSSLNPVHSAKKSSASNFLIEDCSPLFKQMQRSMMSRTSGFSTLSKLWVGMQSHFDNIFFIKLHCAPKYFSSIFFIFLGR